MRAKLIALAVVGAAAALSLTCSPLYLIRAGIEEGKILSRRRPIERVIRDPGTSAELRRKLDLVLRARTFAGEALDLDVGDSYTTYSWIERDTLALVLSAARKDRFEEHTWWFPIVGDVPYKGFFSLGEARAAAEELEGEGYDTYIRPTSAFSTLGWFNDPLLSTVVGHDDVALVSTVIHEVTHNTLYLPSQVSFNESFASFVGDRGAVAFFCGMEGEDGERCRTARDRWSDNLLFGRYLQSVIDDLERLYARDDLTRKERIARREGVFDRARRRFRDEVRGRLRTDAFTRMGEAGLDNARLVAWQLYYDRLHLFETAFERHDGDLAGVVDAILDTSQHSDGAPFDALRRLADVDPPNTPLDGATDAE